MSNISIRIVRSDGKEFFADGRQSDPADWGITAISGISSASIENFTENKAVGDGDIVNGNRLQSREIEFTAIAKNRSMNTILRRYATSFFNPKYDYRIYVTYNGTTMWIDGIIQAVDIPSDHVRVQQSVTVNILCPDPPFHSMDEFGADIASISPLWTFEEIDDPDFGEPFDSYEFLQGVDITNNGDLETFCTVIIKANGSVTNPKFTSGSAYIRVLDTMEKGDVIEIDIAKRRITKNGENILAKIDRTSDFVNMAFAVGVNTVSFDADVGATLMSVRVYYNKLYLGV